MNDNLSASWFSCFAASSISSTHDEVGQRQCVDLLFHPLGCLAPEVSGLGRPTWILMGLLLVIDLLFFPMLDDRGKSVP